MVTQQIKEKFSEFYVGGGELVVGYRWMDNPPMYLLDNGYIAEGPIPKMSMLHEQADDAAIRRWLLTCPINKEHFMEEILNIIDHGNPYDRIDYRSNWSANQKCNVRMADGNIVGFAQTMKEFQKVCLDLYPRGECLTFSSTPTHYFAVDFTRKYTIRTDRGEEVRNDHVFSCKFDDKYEPPYEPTEEDYRD